MSIWVNSVWMKTEENKPKDYEKYLVWFPDRKEFWVCEGYTYGRVGEPWSGTWSVPDGRGGYYGEADDSDEKMWGTWYCELPEPPQ